MTPQTTPKPSAEDYRAAIAAAERTLADLRTGLSELEQGRVTVQFGATAGQPLGSTIAESSSEYHICAAVEKIINQHRMFSLVGAIQVWINDDLGTARTLYVTEKRELNVGPF